MLFKIDGICIDEKHKDNARNILYLHYIRL